MTQLGTVPIGSFSIAFQANLGYNFLGCGRKSALILCDRDRYIRFNCEICPFHLSKGLAVPLSSYADERDFCFYAEVMLLEIGFIGAGKVGKALGLYFKRHGLKIAGYYSKTAKSAQEAALLTASTKFASIRDIADSSSIIFIAVPDQVLEIIDCEAVALINDHSISKEKTWIHVSGAHPSDILTGLKSAGCAVGSVHPLQSFGEPSNSAEQLEKVWFTIEGTEKAVQAAQTILDQTGGKYSLIEAENKPLYHTGACVISNFLVTLLESGIQLFAAAGMQREDIMPAIEPLIKTTLSNVREKGTIEALTGPIVRGDFNTINDHLQALAAQLPCELDLYKSMALKTVRMLENKRLTPEQAAKIVQILEETSHAG
ncbi:MAG TPA: hypothetical protein DHW84_07180 [Firmicutes bacterium]|nr:hypothetical protein [Bacillota bacterium]